MNYVKSNNKSLKYKRVTPSGRRNKWIKKFEFVAKTQILSGIKSTHSSDSKVSTVYILYI